MSQLYKYFQSSENFGIFVFLEGNDEAIVLFISFDNKKTIQCHIPHSHTNSPNPPARKSPYTYFHTLHTWACIRSNTDINSDRDGDDDDGEKEEDDNDEKKRYEQTLTHYSFTHTRTHAHTHTPTHPHVCTHVQLTPGHIHTYIHTNTITSREYILNIMSCTKSINYISPLYTKLFCCMCDLLILIRFRHRPLSFSQLSVNLSLINET